MSGEMIGTVEPRNVELLRNRAADFEAWLSNKEIRVARPEILIPPLSEQRMDTLLDGRPMAAYRKLMTHLLTLPENEQLPAYMYMCGFPEEDIQGVFGADAVEDSAVTVRAYEQTLQEHVSAQTPAKAIAQKAVKAVVALPHQIPTQIEGDFDDDDDTDDGLDDDESGKVDAVRQYMKEMRRHKLLRAEEEVFYGQKVQAGIAARELLDAPEDLSDEKQAELLQIVEDAQRARGVLINANLRRVFSIAKGYPRESLSLLDHIQEGNIGLMRAVEKFDPNRGIKFNTYATWWIHQAIAKANQENSRDIRIPVDASNMVRKLRQRTAELTQELGRHPTNQELAADMELPLKKIVLFQQYARDMPSLDEPISAAEGSRTIGSQIADPRAQRYMDEMYNQRILTDALSQLSERQCRIVMLTYGLQDGQKHTAQQVADMLDISEGLVRQEIRTSKDLLRKYPGLQGIYEEMNG